MPRRNCAILIAVAVISLACGLKFDRHASILGYAMREIHGRYFADVDRQLLFEAAMQGMVDRLDAEFDDEHSAYIKPSDKKAFKEVINQQFAGVGIEVMLAPETKQLVVIVAWPDRPAQKAGVRSGDKILAIDGRSTQGMSLMDAVKLMQGRPGTSVTLGVLHKGDEEPVDVKIVREIINADTVVGRRRRGDGHWDFWLPGGEKIGYLRIKSFTDNTATEMQEAAAELLDAGLRGLVIDLRGDPGGVLNQAVKIADMFIRCGAIVSVRGRNDQVFVEHTAKEEGTLPDFPVAVLIDHETASAGEILAACLQDHDRAVIVGQRSFGKGTIQELIELESRLGVLKLTTGTYWRPSGKNINRGPRDEDDDDWGVRPDAGYEVSQQAAADDDKSKPQKPENASGPSRPSKRPATDPVLDKATEYIRSAIE